ncbi:hypothetical protein Taro_016131 [Colocasia esculenta]|uniref:Uncharacterized protein n=1 Tax=Colocasia esculenta TaxID=4460 RepID=A0A843UPC9_COLES|nr:hypothetical protein [Colocasia esculenta]
MQGIASGPGDAIPAAGIMLAWSNAIQENASTRHDVNLTLTGQRPRETSRRMGVRARSEPRRDPPTRFRITSVSIRVMPVMVPVNGNRDVTVEYSKSRCRDYKATVWTRGIRKDRSWPDRVEVALFGGGEEVAHSVQVPREENARSMDLPAVQRFLRSAGIGRIQNRRSTIRVEVMSQMKNKGVITRSRSKKECGDSGADEAGSVAGVAVGDVALEEGEGRIDSEQEVKDVSEFTCSSPAMRARFAFSSSSDSELEDSELNKGIRLYESNAEQMYSTV